MAKAYSLDLRERVFDLLAKGKSKLFIEETLGVATKTILKWQRHYEKTGSIEESGSSHNQTKKGELQKGSEIH